MSRTPQDPAAYDSPDANLSIRATLGKLDSAKREILLLREFEQLSYSAAQRGMNDRGKPCY